MEVDGLSVATGSGVRLISDFCVSLRKGEAVAVVGASGAGKSLLIRAMLGVFDQRKLALTGHLRVNNGEAIDLSQANAATRFELGICGLVANPRLMLNPVIKINAYFDWVLKAQSLKDRKERFAEACRLLTAVGISDAAVRMNQYPFQLSGGTAQRVCIALALLRGQRRSAAMSQRLGSM